MRLFVANVGVNAADAAARGLRSPIFPDGTFEFVPIKERSVFADSTSAIAYRDLPSLTGRAASIADFLPSKMCVYKVHADPEFDTFTYGDVRSPRAANLDSIAPGDQLWFLARLWDHDGSTWLGGSDFYFVGYFHVDDNVVVIPDVAATRTSEATLERIKRNAHYRRLQAGDRSPFRVVIGEAASSHRFRLGLRVTPQVAGHVYGGLYDPHTGLYQSGSEVLRGKNGKPRKFETFGSATRSIQAFLDSRHPHDVEHIAALGILAANAE